MSWLFIAIAPVACDYGLEADKKSLELPTDSVTQGDGQRPGSGEETVEPEDPGCESDEAPYFPRVKFEADIDDYNFIFTPDPNFESNDPNIIAGGTVETAGEVDGPLKHNGSYTITADGEIKFHVGNNSDHDNDLDISAKLDGKTLTANGTVYKGDRKNETKVTEATSKVTGAGTKKDKWKAEFTDDKDKKHTIEWWEVGKKSTCEGPEASAEVSVVEI